MRLLKICAVIISLSTALMTSNAAFSDTSMKQSSSNYNHWLIRLRSLTVLPESSSSTISTIGGNVTQISNQVVPELDFSYFFTPHVAAELILATTRNSVTATGTAIGTVPLGRVSLLPPTLTVQYHFLATPKVDPYVGLGLNYTFFYDASPSTVSGINYANNAGLAMQAGLDLNMTKKWVFNIDVKKIFVNSSVSTSGPSVVTIAHIDPWLLGIGIGYRI